MEHVFILEMRSKFRLQSVLECTESVSVPLYFWEMRVVISHTHKKNLNDKIVPIRNALQGTSRLRFFLNTYVLSAGLENFLEVFFFWYFSCIFKYSPQKVQLVYKRKTLWNKDITFC